MSNCKLFLLAVILTLVMSEIAVDKSGRVSRHFSWTDPYVDWPSYTDLPLDPSYPTKAAWGVWGADDTEGALNHINQTTIKNAASEIRVGQAFPLNLELFFMPQPILPRRQESLHFVKAGPRSNDDVIMLNTQASTQLDGLRHYPYSDYEAPGSVSYQFYNDLIINYEEIIGPNFTEVLGMQQAAEKGIVARGVLLDYKAWKDSKGETFNPLKAHPVTVSELNSVAKWQGLPKDWSKPGDILTVRFGWIEAFSGLEKAQREAMSIEAGECIGLVANHESAEWLWEKKLAMVGGDNPAFEEDPLIRVIDGKIRSLHQIMVAGWGRHILEYLDLEQLALALQKASRSTFFITIQPLNVNGGVASPPNAMAII